ncbi:MAG: glycosyltransferase family 39 protein [Bacteroidales bacterium]|nr:glycosyltransferase family 39 protein [Bacteroidales bacterium]
MIITKISWLKLPFYWDEAWSYAMAIFDMANKGPTIIPGYAHEWFTRGHPLFFYFIASSWLVIFGKSLLSAHLFALFISCSSLFIIHYCSKKLISINVANIVVSALMVQSMFLAQSTLLLPEIFLMGLSFFVFYLYFQKKWWLFITASFCLILSKETALVLFIVFVLDKILIQKLSFRKEYQYDFVFLKETFFVIVPFLFFGIFLIVQKRNLGYFFYPEHTQMVSFAFGEFLKKFSSICEHLFIRDARWIWTVMAIVSLSLGIIKKRFNKKEMHFFIISSVFILGYLIFSALNFFTIRYILTILPFFLLLSTFFVLRILSGKIGNYLVAIAVGVTLFYGLIYNNSESDISRTFNQTVMAHKEAVNFCESQQWHEKEINTSFLMSFNLKFPYLGYLNNGEKTFANVGNYEKSDIYIFYSTESNPRKDEIKEDVNYELVKRITKSNGCIVEIYKKRALSD